MKTIKTGIDIAALIGGSAVTVGGAIATYNMIKDKKGAAQIMGGVLVTLVGIYATQGALSSIRDKKD
jgi:hypothetical protein